VGVDHQVVWWPGRGSLGRRLTFGGSNCLSVFQAAPLLRRPWEAGRVDPEVRRLPVLPRRVRRVQYSTLPNLTLLRLRLSSPFTFYIYEVDLLPTTSSFRPLQEFLPFSAQFSLILAHSLACASCVAAHTLQPSSCRVLWCGKNNALPRGPHQKAP
jgi:hypothetical protein